MADDHPLFRKGSRTHLPDSRTSTLVGEAPDGDIAVTLTLELQPDVVLMDLSMPGMSGIDATREISARAPDVGVLVLTMFEDDDTVFAAMRAGARGYLLKGAGQDDVERAIRSVAAGEAVFGAAVATRLLGYFAAPPATTFPELTDREREVLELLASGKNNQAIAERARAEPQDRAQPRIERLRQAAGGRSPPGDRQGTRRRPRPQLTGRKVCDGSVVCGPVGYRQT